MASEPTRWCEVSGCERPTEGRRSMCEAHRKRKLRGQSLLDPITARPPTPWARLVEACISLADADPEDDAAYTRAADRLRAMFDAAVRAKVQRLMDAAAVTPSDSDDLAQCVPVPTEGECGETPRPP
jgi:hypothetical protein